MSSLPVHRCPRSRHAQLLLRVPLHKSRALTVASVPDPNPLTSGHESPKPPLYSWRTFHGVNRIYLTDSAKIDHAVAALRGPLGFDLEWKPSFLKGQPENPTSLVQLASSDTILLMQLSGAEGIPKFFLPSRAIWRKVI